MDGETSKDRDARIHQLFCALDVHNKGHLSLADLQAGLRHLNHREFVPLFLSPPLTPGQVGAYLD